ncbi:MAG: F0F1 ATP synthase subunit alpha [Puniceicoccales bacterium]|jgi:F-type H+-transporting ATPase subunit alpha|nr:F0F1 ATP synthase subunit alpha [Puniceicoccales bacterium]
MGQGNELLRQIRDEINALKPRAIEENVGHVLSVADGVVRAGGLSRVRLNEVVLFQGGSVGMALNLEEDNVGIIVLDDDVKIAVGDEVKAGGSLLSMPVGMGLLGRAVSATGKPVDGRGEIVATAHYPVEKVAHGIIPRQSVSKPLQTGILAIDSMIPIGRGQRELIIGDRSTGKTSIAIDTIINQARINRAAIAAGDGNFRPVYSVYVSIGQKRADLARILQLLDDQGAMEYATVVVASSSESVASQYIAPYAATAVGEWFMDNGMDALIVYDDLSRHAVAYRQISLVLKRPAGRQAYPGDIFYLHSRLLERAAKLSDDFGGGSLTALPIVETQAGDMAAYIPTNIISITDGQIYIDTELFNRGVRPAIATGISVSRVGSAAQIKAFRQVAGGIKLKLGQYYEMQSFAQFGSELDQRTRKLLDDGGRIVELFKQGQQEPKAVEMQIFLLWAVMNGRFDDVAVERAGDVARRMGEWLSTAHGDLLKKIADRGAIDGEMEKKMASAVERWKKLNGANGKDASPGKASVAA